MESRVGVERGFEIERFEGGNRGFGGREGERFEGGGRGGGREEFREGGFGRERGFGKK